MTMAANWPMLAALHLLLHSDRLFIGAEKQRLPAILEASRRYQNEVSIRLAGQVLRALNELVRGFQEADRAARGRFSPKPSSTTRTTFTAACSRRSCAWSSFSTPKTAA